MQTQEGLQRESVGRSEGNNEEKNTDFHPQPLGSLVDVVKKGDKSEQFGSISSLSKRLPRAVRMEEFPNRPEGYCHPPGSPLKEGGFSLVIIPQATLYSGLLVENN